jgi:hypothetical protein
MSGARKICLRVQTRSKE